MAALPARARSPISTHALREEGDPILSRVAYTPYRFLPTPSARRATLSRSGPCHHQGDFYPRPPRGGRLCCTRLRHDIHFLISTHALREEGDKQTDGRLSRK